MVEEYNLVLVHETDLALLVEWDNDRFWLPKSQVEELDRNENWIVLEIPEWLAIERGLE